MIEISILKKLTDHGATVEILDFDCCDCFIVAKTVDARNPKLTIKYSYVIYVHEEDCKEDYTHAIKENHADFYSNGILGSYSTKDVSVETAVRNIESRKLTEEDDFGEGNG